MNEILHHRSETLISDASSENTNKRYGFNHGFQVRSRIACIHSMEQSTHSRLQLAASPTALETQLSASQNFPLPSRGVRVDAELGAVSGGEVAPETSAPSALRSPSPALSSTWLVLEFCRGSNSGQTEALKDVSILGSM